MFEHRGVSDGMGWLDFIASIIGSLAWPVAAVIIALAFRKHISGLFNKIRRFSWGDTSVELSEQLDKVETTSQAIPDSLNKPPSPLPNDRFQQLLEISPSAAILDSWRNVEQMLLKITPNRLNDNRTHRLPSLIAKHLLEDGTISGSVYEMISDLQRIRNVAAHQSEVSPTDAYRFNELVEKVTRALDLKLDKEWRTNAPHNRT
tara:strand:+ start:3179 stop:3790 length:612 start_codon:yes stop_codon:yes gene_type:complete